MPSSPLRAVLVGGVLLALTVPIAGRIARRYADPALSGILVLAFLGRCVCSALQIYVVDHIYGGVADFNRYDGQGVMLASHFRAGHFGLFGISPSGNGFVSLVTGVVYTIIGSDQMAGFLVFTWLAFLGLLAFYSAFRIAVPGGDHRRYVWLILFFPSLMFWTSAVGKEALVLIGLGLAANGAARLLARRPGGWPRVVFGMAWVAMVRPHEALLLFGGIAVAMLLRRDTARSGLGPLRKMATGVAVVAGGVALFFVTAKFLKSGLGTSSISQVLNQTHTNTQGSGAGFGSSSYGSWSSNPVLFPKDVFLVLFDPLPIQVHNTTQLLASAENSMLIVLFMVSLRRMWAFVRSVLARPYFAMCAVYSLGFLYVFAALGNLGLLDRERTLLFPFLFVAVAVPAGLRSRSPVGEEVPALAAAPAGPWRWQPATASSPWAWSPPGAAGRVSSRG